MSSHLAAALVVFAVLQIAVVAKLGGSLPMHLGIFLAIGGFSIAARNLEYRWARLTQGELSQGDAGLSAPFRADVIVLWSATLVAPFLWIPVSIISGFLFG